MNIYVGNLSYTAKDNDLKEAFEAFGEVTSAKIITDRYSGDSKGFGFVEMPVKEEALSAINELNGVDIKGNTLVVNEARQRSNNRKGNRNKSGWQGSRKGY
jgi:RNA recognition motif-containing protein